MHAGRNDLEKKNSTYLYYSVNIKKSNNSDDNDNNNINNDNNDDDDGVIRVLDFCI